MEPPHIIRPASACPFDGVSSIEVEGEPAPVEIAVDETGRRTLERERTVENPSPEKKARNETKEEFEAAFSNLKQACTTAKIHLHKRDMAYVRPCLEALKNLYITKHAKNEADSSILIAYEKDIGDVLQSLLHVLSTCPEELSAEVERDLMGVFFEMTEARYMNLNGFVNFCCKGKLPGFKGEPGEALAKVLHRFATHFTQQSYKDWTLEAIRQQVKENYELVNEDFIETLSKKESKDQFDVELLVCALQCTFMHAPQLSLPMFQCWLKFFKSWLAHDVDIFVRISQRFFVDVRHDAPLNNSLLAIYFGPIIRDLDTSLPLEQLVPICKLLLWLLADTSLPSYCQGTVDTIIDRMVASDLKEENYLVGFKLLLQRYKHRHVSEISDGMIERFYMLCNKFRNTVRTLPFLEILNKHDRFLSLWNIVEPIFFQSMHQFQASDGMGQYIVVLLCLINIQGTNQAVKLGEDGQNILIQYVQKRLYHLKTPQKGVPGVEILACAKNLTTERFTTLLKEFMWVDTTTPSPTTPQICSLHHSDKELADLVQLFLSKYEMRKLYITLIHYLVVHHSFTVTILNKELFLELLCDGDNPLWKLDSLETFFQFPEIRNSPQAKVFFEQIITDGIDDCDPLLVLGKLARQNILPQNFADIVTNIIKILPITPGTRETTSKVFDAIGWIANANISIRLDIACLTNLYPLIIQRGTSLSFNAVQKQRIVFGIRELARNNIIPESWIEFVKEAGD